MVVEVVGEAAESGVGNGGRSQSRQVFRRWASKSGKALGIQEHILEGGRKSISEGRRQVEETTGQSCKRFRGSTGGELDPWIGPGNLTVLCIICIKMDGGWTDKHTPAD